MDLATTIVTPTVDISPPEVPNILSAIGINNKITLTFTQQNSSPVPIINYAYSIDNGQTFTDFNPKQKSSPITISGLTNGQRYSVSIKAFTGYYSDATASVRDVLVNYPQPAPIIDTQLTIASGEKKQAKLYFSQPTNNANAISSYLLSINGAEFKQINLSQVLPTESQDKKYIQISELTNGQIYSFLLKSNNSLTIEPLYSEIATVNNVLINSPQPAPVITNISYKSGSAVVYFTQPTNRSLPITGYSYSIDNGVTYTDINVTNSSLKFSGFKSGIKNNITLKNKNGLVSDPSNTYMFTYYVTAGKTPQ